MNLDDAVRDGVRSLAARPAQLLPFYVAGLAVPVIVRVVPFLGIFLAYLSVRDTGRLEAVRAELEPAAPINVDDPRAVDDPDAVGVDPEALEEALLDLLTPTVIAILAATALVTIVLFAVMQSAVSAGRLHAAYAVLSGEPGTRAGVDGVFEHTRTFLGLAILELLAYVLLFAVPIGLVWVAAFTGFALLVLPAIPLFFLAFFLVLAVRLVFAFTRPVAVVDGVGAVPALKGAWSHVRSNLGQSIGYGAFAVGFVMVANMIGGAFSQAGVVTVQSLLPIVFVFPVTDAAKTSLYARDVDVPIDPPAEPEGGRVERLRAGIGRGWSALAGFTRGHLGGIALSTGILVAGVGIGLWAGQQVDDLFVTSIEARLGQQGPISSFFHYAANNWSVAAGQSLAGLAFGVPTVVSLAFNGANVGFLYQLELDPELLIAFVVPHGLIEIPALIVSGALGLHLGRAGWGYVFGTADRDRIAEAIDRGFQVLVGLAVLFVLAAVIEAFVSPYYWQLLGI